jgi:hypothetical protein
MIPPVPLRKVILVVLISLGMIAIGIPQPLFAQNPKSYSPAELDKLVSRIALYPDPLLAQVLAAATYPDEIPDAAKWADEHHYLKGDDLAAQLPKITSPGTPACRPCCHFPLFWK